jgi:Protein of unknown function (DUF3179)
VWEREVNGRPLNFHLAGINNQNFIMRDDETGSWWQQVSGEAIFGPLKGARLKQVIHDELSMATWKTEQPRGRVLRPDQRVAADYETADWEERYARLQTVTPANPEDPFPPRELVIGISAGGESKAYPLSVLRRQSPIIDTLGGVPIVVLVGDDNKSVRAYDRRLDGRELEFFARPGLSPLRLVDTTGSDWDFSGKAISGSLAGSSLQKIAVLPDYWFDWKAYHPETKIYR